MGIAKNHYIAVFPYLLTKKKFKNSARAFLPIFKNYMLDIITNDRYFFLKKKNRQISHLVKELLLFYLPFLSKFVLWSLIYFLWNTPLTTCEEWIIENHLNTLCTTPTLWEDDIFEVERFFFSLSKWSNFCNWTDNSIFILLYLYALEWPNLHFLTIEPAKQRKTSQ